MKLFLNPVELMKVIDDSIRQMGIGEKLNKIQKIRIVLSIFDCGLKAGKQAVEAIEEYNNDVSPVLGNIKYVPKENPQHKCVCGLMTTSKDELCACCRAEGNAFRIDALSKNYGISLRCNNLQTARDLRANGHEVFVNVYAPNEVWLDGREVKLDDN